MLIHKTTGCEIVRWFEKDISRMTCYLDTIFRVDRDHAVAADDAPAAADASTRRRG